MWLSSKVPFSSVLWLLPFGQSQAVPCLWSAEQQAGDGPKIQDSRTGMASLQLYLLVVTGDAELDRASSKNYCRKASSK